MDTTLIVNFLLFLGAFGASFASQSDDSTDDSGTPLDDPDALYQRADYSGVRSGTAGDDDATADQDNLAWFMEAGDDTVTGSSSRDYASLGTGDDAASMGAGNDIVEAGAGNDLIAGGNGNDIELGEAGNDSLSGDLGEDSLSGGTGNDQLLGGSGADILAGGDGDDTISGFNANAGATAQMTGSDGGDELFGGTGNDTLLLGRGDAATGGTGDDTFQLDGRWRDGTGVFTIHDYSGADDQIVLMYAPSIDPHTSLPIVPQITVETSADGASALIKMNGTLIAQVEGGAGLKASDIGLQADTTTDTSYQANAYASEVHGTTGADTYTGTTDPTAWITEAGADRVTGSMAADYARLGDGDDVADMGAGADSVRGDAGNDDLGGDAGNDTLHGGDGNDTVDGGADTDIVVGGLGNDLMTGGAGADQVFGGGGDDTVSGYTATGGGEDSLTAIDGADSLYGGEGSDRMIIGRGDFAAGGLGNDTFHLDARWDEASAIATINDYLPGADRIELEYTPTYGAGGAEIPPVVTVIMGPNNAYAVITLNSNPVAHVTGATGLTLADVTLVRA